LLTLSLESQCAEHHDPFALFEAAHYFGVVEIALAELHDTRMENGLRAVRREYEARAVALWTPAHFGRGRQGAALSLTACAATA
jgi:hypothetical protein